MYKLTYFRSPGAPSLHFALLDIGEKGLFGHVLKFVSRFHMRTSYYRMRLHGHSVSRQSHTCQKFEVWIINHILTFARAWTFAIWMSQNCPPLCRRAWALKPLTTQCVAFSNRRRGNMQCINSFLVHVQILNLYFLDFNSFQGSRGCHTRLQDRRVSFWHNNVAYRAWGI